VGIAQLAVAVSPVRLKTYSLGSCVALVLYDWHNRIGGLAHVMLPESRPSTDASPAKFADQVLGPLLQELEQRGASRCHVGAGLVGGAALFGTNGAGPSMGERNVAALQEHLRDAGIPVRVEDTGGDFARTVVLSTADGTLHVHTVARGDYELPARPFRRRPPPETEPPAAPGRSFARSDAPPAESLPHVVEPPSQTTTTGVHV